MANLPGAAGANAAIAATITVDPSAGAGVPAPIGSLFSDNAGNVWAKAGALDTDWIKVGSIVVSTPDPTKHTTLASDAQAANQTATFPDLTGVVLVSTPATPGAGGQVFINATGPTVGSNAGVQLNSDVANRGQLRGNQYGNHGGIAGITGFKSRGATIGALAAVQPGDVLCRMTGIGVTGNNANIPNAGYVSLQVPAGGVFATWNACDFSVTTTNLAGVQAERMLLNSEGQLKNTGARIVPVRVINGNDALNDQTDRAVILDDNTGAAFVLTLPVGVDGLCFKIGISSANSSNWTLTGSGGNAVDASIATLGGGGPSASTEIIFIGNTWYKVS